MRLELVSNMLVSSANNICIDLLFISWVDHLYKEEKIGVPK